MNWLPMEKNGKEKKYKNITRRARGMPSTLRAPSIPPLDVSKKIMKNLNLNGSWMGNFKGTNTGGISIMINQFEHDLGGLATMNEPGLGLYQYQIKGRVDGEIITLKLVPGSHAPNIMLGAIEAKCRIQEDGSLIGNWSSTIGTNGLFTAVRYGNPQNGKEEKNRTKVFISYSHQDKKFLDSMLIHLRPLERRGLIDVWDDTKIKSGALWKEEIEAALRLSKVAILLISPDFLASDFIVDNELPPLLKKSQSDGVRILPLIVRTCRFVRDENLSVFQAVNDPQKPLATIPSQMHDEVYDKLSAEIETMLKDS